MIDLSSCLPQVMPQQLWYPSKWVLWIQCDSWSGKTKDGQGKVREFYEGQLLDTLSCVFGICGGFHSDSMIKGKLKWISENEYINLHFVIYTNNHLKSRPLNCYTSAQHRQINLLKQRQSGLHHADGTFKHIYIKRPLTPNMLNYFEDYKYIFTFWIISSAWPKKMKLTLEQQYISMA